MRNRPGREGVSEDQLSAQMYSVIPDILRLHTSNVSVHSDGCLRSNAGRIDTFPHYHVPVRPPGPKSTYQPGCFV